MRISGGCHCGNLSFVCDRMGEPLTVRACQCSFCRAHGAATASDPRGDVVFRIADPRAVSRYRFGDLRLAEMLVCARCGVYVGAVMETSAGLRATVNVRAARDFPLPEIIEHASYDGETAAVRSARRQARWTPARFEEGAFSGPGSAR